ncbi:hypothetical protein EJ377_04200 [Chryseobacterium arthrosphaerae]|uniref:Uncharacterized protein n=1 Tax=Chryseobacterium arthrosphaerae TaxID=651561 RepID=A0A432DZ55_9FLAO|nr:hypothetical protein EJ377_04200 [Chryseobacterium arthrosphaerae]
MKFQIIMMHMQKSNHHSSFDLFVFIFLTLMRPTSAKRFLRLQASLPTSKIKSLAKGIVEVEGTLIMKEPLSSPVDHEICIGYYYTIEDIDRILTETLLQNHSQGNPMQPFHHKRRNGNH